MDKERKALKVSESALAKCRENSEGKTPLTRAYEASLLPVEYKAPVTFGNASKEAVSANDACITHVLNHYRDEINALALPRFIGYTLLASLQQEPLIRSGIETIADDMTRKFVKLSGGNDDSEKLSRLNAALRRFKVRQVFNRALALSGYQGGCLVYIDVGPLSDEAKKEPLILSEKLFKSGKLRGFRIIEPINVSPGYYNANDPADEYYFKPETWYVQGTQYHSSRFLYFSWNEVPQILKPIYNFFGISASQQILEYVQNFTENRRAAQRLLNKFSLTIWKTDMAQVLSGGDCSNLDRRAKLAAIQRSNDGIMLLDKEMEEMEQINTPLSGVSDIVSMSLDMAPVILGISKDKYFGDLPKGLNASSEGTNRIYYDKIQSLNEKIAAEPFEKVLRLLQLNDDGKIDENIDFEFVPLWEMDEKEKVEIRKMEADRDAVYLDRGVLSPEEIRRRLAEDPQSGFDNIDPDDVPENDDFADVQKDDKDEAGSVFDSALSSDEWEESKHSRKDNGQFGSGSGNGSESGKTDTDMPEEWGKSFSEYSGKPKEAIEKLMSEKSGYVPGAVHKDGIGEIDFVYGDPDPNTGYGLAHIAEKHGKEILKEIPDVIKQGQIDERHKRFGRLYIQSDAKKMIVRLDWDGKAMSWLATAFIETKTPS